MRKGEIEIERERERERTFFRGFLPDNRVAYKMIKGPLGHILDKKVPPPKAARVRTKLGTVMTTHPSI